MFKRKPRWAVSLPCERYSIRLHKYVPIGKTLKGVLVEREELLEKVKAVIVDQLNVEEDDVTEDANFVDDLGADSLDIVELVMALEEEFGITISDEDAKEVLTVGSAYKYIGDRM